MSKKPFRAVNSPIALNPFDKTVTFTFLPELVKSNCSTDILKQLPEKIKNDLLTRLPHIVQTDTNSFRIVKGHLIYKLMCVIPRENKTSHYFWLLPENYGVIKEQEIDKQDNDYLESLIEKHLNPRKPSPSTSARHRSELFRQVCPLCAHALLGPLNGIPVDPTSPNKTYRISCCNSTQHQRNGSFRCQFYAILNEFEYKKFKAGEFPTEVWLTKELYAKCPEVGCGGDLLLRTTYLNADESERKVVCQFCNHSILKTCNYSVDYSLWQPQLTL